jgi:predicted transcriptional regulator
VKRSFNGFESCFSSSAEIDSHVTETLEKAFQEAAKMPGEEQEIFASFLLDELAFRAAVREGIAAADRGEVTPLDDVKKLIPKWAAK